MIERVVRKGRLRDLSEHKTNLRNKRALGRHTDLADAEALGEE
jgi:hypothetical protein